VITIDEGDGKREIVRSGAGLLLKEEAPDGSVREYDYSLRGEPLGEEIGL